jgi:hypothetical protein
MSELPIKNLTDSDCNTTKIGGAPATDTALILQEWNFKHKARSVNISIDNGYGATCWMVELFGEKGKICACEGPADDCRIKDICVENDIEDYIGSFIILADNSQLLYVAAKSDPHDSYCGLRRVILAAIAAYEKLP